MIGPAKSRLAIRSHGLTPCGLATAQSTDVWVPSMRRPPGSGMGIISMTRDRPNASAILRGQSERTPVGQWEGKPGDWRKGSWCRIILDRGQGEARGYGPFYIGYGRRGQGESGARFSSSASIPGQNRAARALHDWFAHRSTTRLWQGLPNLRLGRTKVSGSERCGRPSVPPTAGSGDPRRTSSLSRKMRWPSRRVLCEHRNRHATLDRCSQSTLRRPSGTGSQTQPWRLRSHHSRVRRAVKMRRKGQLSQTRCSVA